MRNVNEHYLTTLRLLDSRYHTFRYSKNVGDVPILLDVLSENHGDIGIVGELEDKGFIAIDNSCGLYCLTFLGRLVVHVSRENQDLQVQ